MDKRRAPATASGSTSSRGRFRYLIFLGNNSELVRHTLQRRSWWSTSIDDEDAAGGVCTTVVSPLGGLTKIDYYKHKVMAEDALLANRFDFCWKPVLGLKLHGSNELATIHSVDTLPGGPAQLVNHFPSVKCIAAKTHLLRGLQVYYARCGLEVFDHVPTTFVVRDVVRSGASEYQRFSAWFRALSMGDPGSVGERMAAKHCLRNLWLLKPSYLNQGKGIKVLDSIVAIKEHLLSVDRDGLSVDGATVSAGAEWVIQKYVERPLLINGRKFDIRIWVAVTDTFNIYVYNDAYCRTSSEIFSLDVGKKSGSGSREHATFVHLTNYCMQKHSSRVGQFELGNTLSLEQLQTYLDGAFGDGFVDFRKDLFPRMKELILDSVLANRQRLVDGTSRKCFELFGYDFLLDEDFRCWLIEVNTNPYIDKQNPWHHRLLLRMMEDLTSLCIDPVFPPPPTGVKTPLPEECYTQAFTYKLRWKPVAQRAQAAVATEEDPEAGGMLIASSAAAARDSDALADDDEDDHGVEGAALRKQRSAGVGLTAQPRAPAPPPSPARAAAQLPRATAASRTAHRARPVGSKTAAVDHEDEEEVEDYRGLTHYRDPRQNGWELLFTEDERIDVLSIPHQLAMSKDAINAAVVEAAAKAGGVLTAADVRAAGLPLRTVPLADDDVDGADVAADAELLLTPFTRRYIRRRDASWLYPISGTPTTVGDAPVPPTSHSRTGVAKTGGTRRAGAETALAVKAIMIADARSKSSAGVLPPRQRNARSVSPREPVDSKLDDDSSDDADADAEDAKQSPGKHERGRTKHAQTMHGLPGTRSRSLRAHDGTDDGLKPPLQPRALPSSGWKLGSKPASTTAPGVISVKARPPLAHGVDTVGVASSDRMAAASLDFASRVKRAQVTALGGTSSAASPLPDTFAPVSLLRLTDRGVWCVTQLRFVLERAGLVVDAVSPQGASVSLPSLVIPPALSSSDGSVLPAAMANFAFMPSLALQHGAAPTTVQGKVGAQIPSTIPVEQLRVAFSSAVTQSGVRRLVLTAVRHLLLVLDDPAALQRAAAEGMYPVMFCFMRIVARVEAEGDKAASTDFADRVLTERSRALLYDAIATMTVAYKRDPRLRALALLPPHAALLDAVAPAELCPWKSMAPFDVGSVGADSSAAGTEEGRASSAPRLRNAHVHALQAAWILAEARCPYAIMLQIMCVRILAALIHVQRSGAPPISPTSADGADAHSPLAAAEDGGAALRVTLTSAGVVHIVACQALIAAHDSRRAARDFLAGFSLVELRKLSRSSEDASFVVFDTQTSMVMTAAMTRELSVRTIARKKLMQGSGGGGGGGSQAEDAPSADEHGLLNAPAVAASDSEAVGLRYHTTTTRLRPMRVRARPSSASGDAAAAARLESISDNAEGELRGHTDSDDDDGPGARRATRRGQGGAHAHTTTNAVPGRASSKAADTDAEEIRRLKARLRKLRREQKERTAAAAAAGHAASAAAAATVTATGASEGVVSTDVDEKEKADERATQIAAALEEWHRKKEEAARVEREKLDAERAVIEAERLERERLRAEKITSTKRKLAEARARENARVAERLRLLALRSKQAAAEAAQRAEVYRQREAGWVGLSSAASAPPPQGGRGDGDPSAAFELPPLIHAGTRVTSALGPVTDAFDAEVQAVTRLRGTALRAPSYSRMRIPE